MVRQYLPTVFAVLLSFSIRYSTGQNLFPFQGWNAQPFTPSSLNNPYANDGSNVGSFNGWNQETPSPLDNPYANDGSNVGSLNGRNQGNNYEDANSASFPDILNQKLMSDDGFRDTYSKPMSVDSAINTGLEIGRSLGNQMGLSNSYSAMNTLTNALTSMNADAGPKDYARSFSKAATEILNNENKLNPNDLTNTANTVAKIIVNSSPIPSNDDNNIGSGQGPGANLPFNNNPNAGANIFSNNNGGPDLGFNRLPDVRTNANADLSSNLNAGLGLQSNLGTGLGAKANIASNLGANANLAGSVVANPNLAGSVGAYPNLAGSIGAGLNGGLGGGLGILGATNAAAGIGADIGADADLDADLNSNIDADIGVDLGGNIGKKAGAGANTEVTTGLNVDLSVSSGDIAQFKTELEKELCRSKCFIQAFSDNVPIPSQRQITAAITQYLSKAFSVPRSYLQPIEKKISSLPTDQTPSAELCAGIISSTLADLLSKANIITASTARLQVTVAAKAVTSGIANFLGIATVPGIGLGINSIFYNSYFSALSGLEKLPYVGIEAISSKLPPVIKTAQAQKFACRFSKILYHNLISSNKFKEVFSLGISPLTCKIIANSLGNFMAEAFGSQSAFFFTEMYIKVLIPMTGSFKDFAYGISSATTEALYHLGYFSLGNSNVQAAIAGNAVIRALAAPDSRQWFVTYLTPKRLGLPLSIRLTGVTPPDSLLKAGIGIGAGADTSVEVGVGMEGNSSTDAKVTTKSDAELGLNRGVTVAFDLGLTAGIENNADLGQANLKVNGLSQPQLQNGRWKRSMRQKRALGRNLLGFDFPWDSNVEEALDKTSGLGADVAGGLSANGGGGPFASIGAGVDAATRIGPGVNAAAGTSAAAGARTGIGAGAVASMNVGSGIDTSAAAGASTGIGAGAVASMNVGSGVDTSASAVAKIGAGGNAAAGLGAAAAVDKGIYSSGTITASRVGGVANGKLGASAVANAGTGASKATGIDPKIGAKAGINADSGAKISSGAATSNSLSASAAAGLGTNIRVVTGTGSGVNTSLSVLVVLPKILASRLLQSTALYTAVSLVGSRKVINLIAQDIASQFGFPVAAVFLNSCNQYFSADFDNVLETTVNALAIATSDALAAAGILNTTFSVFTADQLAAAVVAKFSSLIATSLETRDWSLIPVWSGRLDGGCPMVGFQRGLNVVYQNLYVTPLARGYTLYK